jgi:hypothetical protein
MEKTQVIKTIKTQKPLCAGKRGMVEKALLDPGIKMEEMRDLGKW